MRIVILSIAILNSSSLALANDQWTLIDDRDNIQVFKQKDDHLATISLRGIATIDAPISETYEVMKNSERSTEWVPMLLAKKNLRPLSQTSRIESSLLKMPWPLHDRLFVNVASVEFKADGSYHMSLKGIEAPETSFLVDDAVLGMINRSEFTLRPLNAEQCELFVEVNTDPKGLIPKWIVNIAQKDWPRNFFTGLRKQIIKLREERERTAH